MRHLKGATAVSISESGSYWKVLEYSTMFAKAINDRIVELIAPGEQPFSVQTTDEWWAFTSVYWNNFPFKHWLSCVNNSDAHAAFNVTHLL